MVPLIYGKLTEHCRLVKAEYKIWTDITYSEKISWPSQRGGYYRQVIGSGGLTEVI